MWHLFSDLFDIPSTVNDNVKGNVCFVLSFKHSKRPGTFSQFQPIKRWIGYHGITRWLRWGRNQRRIQWHYKVEIWYVGLPFYFCWIILSKLLVSRVLILWWQILLRSANYIARTRCIFVECLLSENSWLSQKSCCAWTTSVPIEARDQGQEQQRYEGNRRRLIRTEKLTKMLTSGSRERRTEEWWDGSREPHPEILFSVAQQVAALYF